MKRYTVYVLLFDNTIENKESVINHCCVYDIKENNNKENNREFVVNSKGFNFCYPYFLFEKLLEALIEAE